MNRRTVLKGVLVASTTVAADAALGGLLEVLALPDGRRIALARAVVVADPALCSGCRVCEALCSNVWSRGRNGTALARLVLDKDYVGGTYRPKTCWQCAEPPCLDACPVSALVVDTGSGTHARVIDERACIGCKRCLEACARYFDPPRPRFDAAEGHMIKCHLCFGSPQCVEHCPLGALRVVRAEGGLRLGYPIVRETPA